MALRYYVSSEEAPFFVNNKMGSSDRIPTSGTYKVGDFIISNTQADGIFGWVCTVAGTPGTWIEIGSGGGSNTKTLSLSSSTVVSSPVREVAIGIKDFNKNTDFLMVYKNSTYLTENIDYTISSDSKKIVSINGNWNEEALSDYRFSFVVIKETNLINPEAVVGTENIKDGSVTVDKLDEGVKEILNEVSVINNELSKTENTLYTTENGVKEFECKDGYVDNVVIEGETLVNLCYYPNLRNENSDRYFQRFDNRISGSDTYTIIIPKGKDIGFEVYNANEVGTDYGFGVSGDVGVKVVQIPTDHRIATIHCLKADYSEEELKTICETSIILKGDHSNKSISYFEGLKSVGQGDKIEVLSCNLYSNIFNGIWYTGGINTDDGTNLDMKQYINTDFMYFKSEAGKWINVKIFDTNVVKQIVAFFYDENKRYLGYGNLENTNNFRIAPIKNSMYVRFRIEYNGNKSPKTHILKYDYETQHETIGNLDYIQPQYDKKQILTTLRSLPNGVKDTIEKRGNKHYKIKRCGEVTLNGSENWICATSLNDVIRYSYFIGGIAYKPSEINCDSDKFKVEKNELWNNNSEQIDVGNGDISINIMKNKLSNTNYTDSLNIKTWLKSNPVTVVYELETPIIEELPNFNPQTFSDKTTLLLNSGVVQGEASFEVTNSLGSELEVLKGKVSDLDDDIYKLCAKDKLLGVRHQLNGVSLNQIFKYGNYAIRNPKDCPITSTVYLEVINLDNNNTNILQRVTGATKETYDSYFRVKNGESWASWKQITTTSTLSLLEQQISELEIQAMERGI